MSNATHARYHVSERDYVRVARVHGRLSSNAWKFLTLLLLAALGAAAWRPADWGMAIGGALVGLLAAWVAIHYVVNPWLLRRHYRQYKLMQQEQAVTLAPDAVHFSSTAGDTHLRWDQVLKWRHSPDFVLIYPMPALYHMVPARVADQGFDLDGLKAALAQHVGPAA